MPRRIQLANLQRSAVQSACDAALTPETQPAPVLPAALIASGQVDVQPDLGAVLRADKPAAKKARKVPVSGVRRKPAAKRQAARKVR